jgi:tetratricopeptide (TPR) repeat protein
MAYNNLGIALRTQGKTGEAIAEFRKAIELDPQDATAHNNLGMALLSMVLQGQGNADEAIKQLGISIALDPQYASPDQQMRELAKREASALPARVFQANLQQWMALATIDKSDATWVACCQSSRENAIKTVLESCKIRFGRDCGLVSTSNSECLAIARQDSEVYWSFDAIPRSAALGAIDKCETASHKACGLHFARCPDGTNYYITQEWVRPLQ